MIGWVDLETTGLQDKITTGSILEIAVVVTDDDLNEIGAFERVLSYRLPDRLRDVAVLGDAQMVFYGDGEDIPEVVFDMHTKNGLWKECDAADNYSPDYVAQFIVDWLKYSCGVGSGELIMGGANVGSFDRRWLEFHMPQLLGFFHYRSLDISTIKNAVRMWSENIGNPPDGRGQHRAMPDILDSIDVARWYRDNIFKKGTP